MPCNLIRILRRSDGNQTYLAKKVAESLAAAPTS
ncbi:MAG: hypothetical protein RIR70_1907 [Pseudomonadota bacterium]|jgi:hypothetical protein